MPIIRTPIVDDDGTGTTGTVLDNAWKQELYNQIDGVTGAWQDVPFLASNFSAAAPMTWTVGVGCIVRNRYVVVNKTLLWSIYISWFSGSNLLGGSPGTILNMTLPAGLISQGPQMLPVTYQANVAGVPIINGLWAATNGSYIQVQKTDMSTFAVGGAPGMITTFAIEVQ